MLHTDTLLTATSAISDPDRALVELLHPRNLFFCAVIAVLVVWKTVSRKLDLATGVRMVVLCFLVGVAMLFAVAFGYQWGYTDAAGR